MDNFVEAFRKEIYEPVEQKFIAATNQYLLENEADFKGRFKSELQEILSKLDLSEVGYVSCSVLYTTIYFKQPQLLVEVFDKVGQLLSTGFINISWLFTKWQAFNDSLFSQSAHLRKVLKQANIESFMWQAVDILAYLLAVYMRYWLREFIHFEYPKAFSKLAEFYCFYGKYDGQKEIVYAKRQAIDISEVWQEKEAYYCNFFMKKYRSLLLNNVDLSYTVFEDCRFEDCTFDKVDLLDTSFINCKFFNVKFFRTAMSGSLFVDDYFYECSFVDISLNGTMMNNSDHNNVYRRAKIIRARSIRTDFSPIATAECIFIDCEKELADG